MRSSRPSARLLSEPLFDVSYSEADVFAKPYARYSAEPLVGSYPGFGNVEMFSEFTRANQLLGGVGQVVLSADIMNQWADRRLFWSTTPVIFEKLAAVVPKEFIEDRSKMMRGANFAEITLMAPDARNQLRAFLDILDRQLAHSPFLLGKSFSLADAACFHPVWFLRAEPSAF